MTDTTQYPFIDALIDTQMLATRLQSRDKLLAPLKIIDARFDLMKPQYGQEAYQTSRIPTALRVELEQSICAPKTGQNGRHPIQSPEKLITVFQNLGINHGDHVVIYDDKSGMFASHIWWVLRHLGHASVQVLNGGIDAWENAGFALETGAPRIINMPGNITRQESEFSIITTDEILSDLDAKEQRELHIIDARGAARFRGEMEPLDPVAGHIPFAINRPFELNLGEDGLFKDRAVLQAEWEARLAGIEPSQVVHQCGSGVSACHNLFALYYAGFGPTKLYHGSWSEWCADVERPVALGEEA